MKKTVIGIIICALAFGVLGIWHYYANRVQEWDGKPVLDEQTAKMVGDMYIKQEFQGEDWNKFDEPDVYDEGDSWVIKRGLSNEILPDGSVVSFLGGTLVVEIAKSDGSLLRSDIEE